jgi:hypothetical protein
MGSPCMPYKWAPPACPTNGLPLHALHREQQTQEPGNTHTTHTRAAALCPKEPHELSRVFELGTGQKERG